ncbi:MAG: GNAT family N-acetyltransferase [Microcoleaceae cyanobacterium]
MKSLFKLASLSDLEILTELIREFYIHEKMVFSRQAVCYTLQQILNNDGYGQIYLVCINQEIIGYFAVIFSFSLEYHGRNAILDELYIREQYRRQGIGKQTIQFVKEICRKKGINALHLEVDHQNTNAQRLYRQVGFVDSHRSLMSQWLSVDE